MNCTDVLKEELSFITLQQVNIPFKQRIVNLLQIS